MGCSPFSFKTLGSGGGGVLALNFNGLYELAGDEEERAGAKSCRRMQMLFDRELWRRAVGSCVIFVGFIILWCVVFGEARSTIAGIAISTLS